MVVIPSIDCIINNAMSDAIPYRDFSLLLPASTALRIPALYASESSAPGLRFPLISVPNERCIVM